MNSDIDPAILPDGEYISAENIDTFSGVAIPMKGLAQLTAHEYDSAIERGYLLAPEDNKIYYFYTAYDEFNVLAAEGLIEYDISNNTQKDILKTLTGKLGFTTKITGVNLEGDFIFWSDGVMPPRRVDRTIEYEVDGFEEIDISVIKEAPTKAPTLAMYQVSGGENNLEEKFLSFFTNYKYVTGEYSAYSPASRIAFTPENFDFDYSTHTNNGMVNAYNSVNITFDVGNRLVSEVKLFSKEAGSNSVKLIDTFNKAELGYADGSEQSHVFDNSKVYKVMPTDQLNRIFDNVPLLAGAQEIIGNRLLYGDYTEGRDIVDSEGNKIEMKHTVGYKYDTTATKTSPKESVKSNRDLEIAISYQDEQTRSTTPLVSKENTIFIKHENAIHKNTLQVDIPHKAPEFATSYRFFIKQQTLDYEVIIPTLFYEEGVYRWVRYEEADKDKINAGDFLVVKRDSSGLLTENVEVKILEAGFQTQHFLRPEFTGDESVDNELRKIQNRAGYYFKIKPKDFVMDYGDLEVLEDSVYHNTRNKYDNPIRDEQIALEQPYLYGDELLEGITSTGTYTPPALSLLTSDYDLTNYKDIRFTITILAGGTHFDWECNANTILPSPSGANIEILPAGQTTLLDYGVSIVFPENTGYTEDDYITISGKNTFNDRRSSHKAIACLMGFSDANLTANIFDNTTTEDEILTNEAVEGGANITFFIREYGGDGEATVLATYYDFPSSSRRYENLEEWYYGEDISFDGISDADVFFRRGYKTTNDGSYRFYDKGDDIKYAMHILIRGQVVGKTTDAQKRGKISANIKIVQSTEEAQFMLFETRPKEVADNDTFFEIGDTYKIDSNGNHLGDAILSGGLDVDQDYDNDTEAQVNLRFFDCYSFGNGVESYKIKDVFNGNHMRLDARGMTPIDDYKLNRREAELTYSGPVSLSTQVNQLNEFNLGTLNFKELSTEQEGPIRRLATRNGDVIVLQDRLISKVMFGRTILSNVDGTTNVVATNDVLGAQAFYTQKFGIGDYAESYAEFGNNFYFLDPHNGTIVRGGYSGLDEIVYGRKNFFKDELKNLVGDAQGGYDLLKDTYIVSVNDVLQYYKELNRGWMTTKNLSIDGIASMDNRTFAFINGNLFEMYAGGNATASINTVVNKFPHETKVFEALRLESNNKLDVGISASHGDSKVTEYEKREDFYYGEIPKSTVSDSNKYGLGVVDSVNGLNITMKSDINYKLSIGDNIILSTGLIGEVQSISGNTITVDSIATVVISGDYILGEKVSDIEGDSIRGTLGFLEIHFDTSDDHKLLAINVNSGKSFN